MVHLERSRLAAVRAPAVIAVDECTPFSTREVPLGCASTRSICAALRSKNPRMGLVIRGHGQRVLFAVTCVVKPLRRAPLFWVRHAPPTYRLARLLRVALDPFARVRALPLRIFVRHSTYLANSQHRCNGTAASGSAAEGAFSGGLCCARRIGTFDRPPHAARVLLLGPVFLYLISRLRPR